MRIVPQSKSFGFIVAHILVVGGVRSAVHAHWMPPRPGHAAFNCVLVGMKPSSSVNCVFRGMYIPFSEARLPLSTSDAMEQTRSVWWVLHAGPEGRNRKNDLKSGLDSRLRMGSAENGDLGGKDPNRNLFPCVCFLLSSCVRVVAILLFFFARKNMVLLFPPHHLMEHPDGSRTRCGWQLLPALDYPNLARRL